MNKKKLIIIISLIVLLAILAFFLYSNKGKEIVSISKDKIMNNQKTVQEIDICEETDSQETKGNCLIEKIKEEALQSGDILKCLEIENDMSQKSCITKVIQKKPEAIDCRLIKDDIKFLCFSEKYYNQAIKNSDSELCKMIGDNIKRANCLSKVTNTPLHSDVDNDGLSFIKEIEYDTNPNSRDTDNDGFDDWDEILKGYNPLGEGEIEKQPTESVDCENLDEEIKRIYCLEILEEGGDVPSECSKKGLEEILDYCSKNL